LVKPFEPRNFGILLLELLSVSSVIRNDTNGGARFLKKMKICLVIGTRPEGIKLFPIWKELKKYPNKFETRIVATGQHKELVDQVFDVLKFSPDINFDLMEPNQGLGSLSSKLIGTLTYCFISEKPDFVLVQGASTSALMGALAAYYTRIRLGHAEAGLRTHHLFSPFPEEGNRRIIATLAGFHFCPTEGAKENLLKENIPEDQIFVTGNTGIDAARIVLEEYPETPIPGLCEEDLDNRHLILVTAHRRENFGKPLKNIEIALRKIAEVSRKFLIVLPLHLNPIVQDAFSHLMEVSKNGSYPNIKVIPPLNYPEMLSCMKKAFLILTDSGGLVEEASFLGKPVLILREVTERPESVEAGIAKIVGTSSGSIYNAFLQVACACKRDTYKKMAVKKNLYGDGHAAEKIVKILSGLS